MREQLVPHGEEILMGNGGLELKTSAEPFLKDMRTKPESKVNEMW